MSSYLEQYASVREKIAELTAEADRLFPLAREQAANVVQTLLEKSGLTPESILAADDAANGRAPKASTRAGKANKPRAPLPFVYKDPETGKTWSGMGREPGWIKGKNRDDFRV